MRSCLAGLFLLAAIGLGVYSLILIPASNFISGSTGAQNAAIVPCLIGGVICFILSVIFMVLSNAEGSTDARGSGSYSSFGENSGVKRVFDSMASRNIHPRNFPSWAKDSPEFKQYEKHYDPNPIDYSRSD